MWPLIRDSFTRFFTDKTYFASRWDKWVTKVRFLLMALGGAMAIPGAFQDNVKSLIPDKYEPYIGVLFMGLGVLLRAGDKTPENVKELAKSITPIEVTPVQP